MRGFAVICLLILLKLTGCSRVPVENVQGKYRVPYGAIAHAAMNLYKQRDLRPAEIIVNWLLSQSDILPKDRAEALFVRHHIRAGRGQIDQALADIYEISEIYPEFHGLRLPGRGPGQLEQLERKHRDGQE